LKTSPSYIAGELILETQHDPTSVEIGREDTLRYGIALQEMGASQSVQRGLAEGSVFVVSGGTAGITGPIVRDLAEATRGTFYLMGRSPILDQTDPDLAKARKDKAAFRSELQARMKASGDKLTPVQIDQRISTLERMGATLDVMAEIEAVGGRAVYLQCDVCDPESVHESIRLISEMEERVGVLIHAAGLEKSRKIESKTLDEFQQVVSVKVDGFMNLFSALEVFGRLPERVVFFTSVAGRFGNSGQTDYSAANDLLSKYAMWLPKKYPNLQAISIDWGAWADVGMASRGNIPRLMEMAGIGMLAPENAAPIVRMELESGFCGEVVIAGALGALEAGVGNHGGLDIEKADQALRAGTPIHKMLSHLVDFDLERGIRLDAELDPQELAYLRDHSINGIPVLPGVIGIEGFSIAAKHIASVLASGGAGFEIDKLEEIRFLAPFKFYGNKPRTVTWHAFASRRADGLVVNVSLESDIRRRNGSLDHVLHFSGLVYLAQGQAALESVATPPHWGKRKSVSAEEIYQLYFHGPSFQVLDAAQLSGDGVLGRLNKKVTSLSGDDTGVTATPLLIEMCFQTAGLWEAGATGVLALPYSIGSLKLFQRPLNGVNIFADVKPHQDNGQLSFDAQVIDAKGNVFLELRDYRTSPMPYPAENALVKPMRILVSEKQKLDLH
jgi:NAD(P)-dependent dehydrogenase (short-subunit alcohol dehydrogenase family)